jgi:hypothetical protein
LVSNIHESREAGWRAERLATGALRNSSGTKLAGGVERSDSNLYRGKSREADASERLATGALRNSSATKLAGRVERSDSNKSLNPPVSLPRRFRVEPVG